MLKRIVLLSLAIAALAGCSGNATVTPSRYMGSYNGTWVNVADDTDAGTSLWNVSADGVVTGEDYDAGRDTTFDVVGRVDANGNVTSTSTPRDGSGAATLNGQLQFDNAGVLTGLLVWGVEPPFTYRYRFTKR